MEYLLIKTKKIKILSTFLFALIVIFGSISCSSKQQFLPVEVSDQNLSFKYNTLKIDSIDYKLSTLSNGKVIANTGEIKGLIVPDGFKIIYYREPIVLLTDEKGNLEIYKKNHKKRLKPIKFKSKVATASISENGDILSYVLDNNSFGLYSLKNNKVIFEDEYKSVTTYDKRLPNPIFYKDKIYIFTLDGHMVIIDASTDLVKAQKSLNISSGLLYSNVIDYDIEYSQYDTNFAVLTQTELVLIKNDKIVKRHSDNIRGAIFDKDFIFLLTKNGEIIKFNRDLEEQDRAKFPLAYFVNFGESGNFIYLLESQGYFIKVRKNRLADSEVFKTELDEENCFVTKTYFICDEKTLNINQPLLK
jgi:hypothetical protein